MTPVEIINAVLGGLLTGHSAETFVIDNVEVSQPEQSAGLLQGAHGCD